MDTTRFFARATGPSPAAALLALLRALRDARLGVTTPTDDQLDALRDLWPEVSELGHALRAVPARERPLPAAALTAGGLRTAREAAQRQVLARTLAATDGNRSRAARQLGLSRVGLLKAMQRLGLAAPRMARGPR